MRTERGRDMHLDQGGIVICIIGIVTSIIIIVVIVN